MIVIRTLRQAGVDGHTLVEAGNGAEPRRRDEVCDLALMGSVGAALAMIPPAVSAESMSAEKPSDALRENAYEVFNIAASILNEVDETDVTAPDYPVGKLALLAPRHGIGPRPSGRS